MSRFKTIKLRINSINSTRQITKAMKLVSASKLRRAQINIENARAYSESLKTMVEGLIHSSERINSDYFIKRPKGVAKIILVTTDKGMCGPLNNNIFKALPAFINEELKDFDGYSFAVFGKKGNDYLRRKEYKVDKSFIELRDHAQNKSMLDYVRECLDLYLQGEYKAVYIIHNNFISMMHQEVKCSKLLPIEAAIKLDAPAQYIYEPSQQEILDRLVPLYVENKAMEALFDSIASEHSARMIAMDAATKNAGELIKKLQLQYNRARQAAITKELIEIISGAEVAVN